MNAPGTPRKGRKKRNARKAGFFSWRYLLPIGFFGVLTVFMLAGLGRDPNKIPSPLIGKAAPDYTLPVLEGAENRLPMPQPAAGKHTATNGTESSGAAGAGNGAGASTSASTSTFNSTSTVTGTGPRDASAHPATNTISAAQLRGQPYLLNVWASWCLPCLQEHPQMIALAKSGRIRMVGMNYKDRPEEARKWLARNGNPFDAVIVDADGRSAIDFGVYGVPETFLIDAEGNIRHKIVGAISIQALQDELLPAIEKLGSARTQRPENGPEGSR